MSDLDDDLAPAGMDLSGYFRLLAARLGRVPTLGEVAAFRHEVASERGRRMRLRRRRKSAKGRAPARVGSRGGGEPDPVREFFSSFEWLAALSIAFSMIVCLTELASLRVRGGRIAMPAATMKAAAVAIANQEDPHGLGPRPLGSFTPDALMLQFRATEAHRASRRAAAYGDPLFPRAVASLIRANGRPIGLVEGRDPWEIVESVDPAACAHLRSLGSDPDLWKPLRLEVRAATKKALEAAWRVANPQLGDPEPRPGYLDHLMQLGTPTGAAAYCARQLWAKAGAKAAAAAAVADVELEPEPEMEPTHG